MPIDVVLHYLVGMMCKTKKCSIRRRESVSGVYLAYQPFSGATWKLGATLQLLCSLGLPDCELSQNSRFIAIDRARD